MRGLSFAVVVIRFTNSKNFHVVIKCLSFVSEAPIACQAAQDCTIVICLSVLVCYLPLQCTLCSSMDCFLPSSLEAFPTGLSFFDPFGC
jgi:hypothetical protein